jgi:membrane protease YdiL (CAAX protease family)
METEIRKINTTLLIFIVILIPINSIVLNYLFKIQFFMPLVKLTDYWVQSTLIANIIGLIIFSVLIFLIGKHNLFSVWLTKKKLKVAFFPLFFIWLLSQLITFIVTFHNTGELVWVGKINILIGSLLGQLFGNAAFEEFIFRGLFFLQLYILFKAKTTKNKALIISIIASQLLFSLIHIPNRLIINQVDNLAIDLICLFVVGVILTIIYIRTENLAFVIGVHTLMNQPFNLLVTSFPMEIVVYILIVLTTILWHKIEPITSFKYLSSNSSL